MKIAISIVIPTCNGGALFERSIEAVSRQKLDHPFEIIVVDSESADGTAEIASRYARVIKIKKSEFNHGLTRNLAISESSGDLIALIVQDAVPQNDEWLQRLVEAFNDPQVAGVYSRQVPQAKTNPIVAARLKKWSAGGSEPRVKQIPEPAAFDGLSAMEKVDILSFDNVASMIRRDVWEKHHFTEGAFGEDTRWALDVLKTGWKIVYEPRSVVVHSHSKSLWYEFKRVYLDHQNWNRLVGLKLFPMPREILRAGFNGIFERWDELNEADLPLPDRVYWKAWAIPYSFSQNLAQFLGAISPKWMDKWPAFKKIDALLRRGV